MGFFLSSLFSRYPRSFFKYYGYHVRKTIRKILSDFQPDIVHFDTLKTVCLAREIKDARIVFHVHDSQTKQIRTRMLKKRGYLRMADTYLQYFKVRYTEKSYYLRSDACIVDSLSDAGYLRALNKNINVKVIPLGFDQNIYNPEGSKAKMPEGSLIFTGSMKSVQTAVAVEELVEMIMPQIWDKRPETTLFLIGANPLKKIREYGEIDKRIIVTGFVENLSDYLRGAAVYLCPLRVGSGMKTRVIEALACGCPLVTTHEGVEGLKADDESLPPWIIGEAPSALAEKTLILLKDKESQQELSIKAAEFALKQNSWKAVSEKIVKLYEEILA
ncbi:MAG: glycosyltransferase family 4 protein [Candidatus Aureabacteria bacterium]|nr:glycosyltransferase family 4 protein [Candidatus Auribacterota bacterium]